MDNRRRLPWVVDSIKQRKVKIMLVLGMIFAVVVALAAEVGVVSNKLA